MRRKLILLLIIAFLFRAVLAFVAWHPDVNNHVDWGIRFWQYGPAQFYDQNVWSFSWPNQPPGTILIFALIRKLYEGIFSFFWWINVTVPVFPSNLMFFFEERLYQALLKLPAILADLGIASIIFWFFKRRQKENLGLWGANIFLWNPVIWYNSSIWGQTDSTVNFFGLFALLLLIERKLISSYLNIFISLFIKASLLILAPVLLVVAWRQKYPISTWAKALFFPLAIVGVLTLPFSQGEPFAWLLALYQEKVFGWQLHLITANAFNLWAAFTGIHERPDTLLFGPLSFKVWGYILFGAAFVPLILKLLKKPDDRTVLWVATLTVFSSFVFLTGIHERYLYPLFPLLTLIVVQERKWLPVLVLLSGIHLINLYNFWWYPRAQWLIEVLSAGDRLLPRIFGAVVTALFLWMYFSFVTARADISEPRSVIRNKNEKA